MSAPGRGRGYTGRHHLREQRPGDTLGQHNEDLDAVRTLAELSPRSTDKVKSHCYNEKETVTPPGADLPPPREKEKEDKMNDELKEDEAIKELLTIDEQYAPLLTLLEQFSPGEDGIQFNRKLRHFETSVTNMCPDETRLQQAFASFRAASLLSAVTARKLAAVGASFTRQQRQQLLRATLLNVVMQGTYCKLELLERANPLFLVNAANLMGDYFAEARLCNGNKVHILASPLLQYMKALLTSEDMKAHRSLATQLMQNGRELLSVLPQELEDLSISIRYRLLKPPPHSIIWLLLSADLCLNKFLPLPNALQQFYASHLDLTPEENFSEVSYGSWKKSPEKDDNVNDLEKVGTSLSSVNLTNDDGKPKLRPILGAGAGLLRQEQALSVSQDSFDTWAPKNNLHKRYDLNSWRQNEKREEDVTSYTDYNRVNYQENYSNYLQQGDGTYIQNYDFNRQDDGRSDTRSEAHSEVRSDVREARSETQPPLPERVNNEVQKSRRVENWRREKSDVKEDSNRRRNWTRQRSRDNLDESERKGVGRRNSGDSESTLSKTPPKRHVSDVPRNHKYWDHDDRCDKDYNS
ncbi:hypothetical protein K1T71_014080 [Dendrolimus kikuchii]|uniref:Uncharacterized protein n=1 Tax=Dendrolimus kikuchii TaxID=765133 RepID=A0ACC1CFC3_9NEOP|nr:hypothetical protein K1T71_014080 [Dendrolimus kikuchii]